LAPYEAIMPFLLLENLAGSKEGIIKSSVSSSLISFFNPSKKWPEPKAYALFGTSSASIGGAGYAADGFHIFVLIMSFLFKVLFLVPPIC
jgi:hypothetical protein